MAFAGSAPFERAWPPLEPLDRELTRWGSGFLLILGLHALILVATIRMQGAPAGGEQTAPPAFDISEMQMVQVIGDAVGNAETMTTGEATSESIEPAASEPAERVEEPAMSAVAPTPLEPAGVDPPANTPPPPMPAVEHHAVLQPADPIAEAAGGPPPPAALAASAPAVAQAPVENRDSPLSAAAQAIASLQEALDPLGPLEASAPAPMQRIETAMAISPPDEAVAATPAQRVQGDIVETVDMAPLPRPRPEAAAQEFRAVLEEQQRQQAAREREERDRAQRQQAERQQAERQPRERQERNPPTRQERQRAARDNEQGQARERPRDQARGRAVAGGGQAQPEVGTGGVTAATYQDRVYRHLQRHKRYPGGASGGGTVTISFTISASGTASGIRIRRSSGDAALDRATLEMVSRASPFPPIPEGLGSRSMSFSVPVQYSRR